MLLVDFLALQSAEYRSYLAWCEPGYEKKSLFPNHAYSMALAHFWLEKLDGPAVADGVHGSAASNLGIILTRSQSRRSSELLQQALLLFPRVLPALVARASIAISQALLGDPFFQDVPVHAMSESEKRQAVYEELFVERNQSLWKSTEVGSGRRYC